MTSSGDRAEKDETMREVPYVPRRGFTILTVTVAISAVGVVLLFLVGLPSPPHCPVVDLQVVPYECCEFEVVSVSDVRPLAEYEVIIITDGEPWIGFPRPVADGLLGQGPAGESLYFYDLTQDGDLSVGDWFSLNGAEFDAQYELMLYWEGCDGEVGVAAWP